MANSAADNLSVLFVALQKRRKADGGLNSLSELLYSLPEAARVLVTQRESEWTAELRAHGVRVTVVSSSYEPGTSLWKGGPITWLRFFWSLIKWNARIAAVIRSLGSSAVFANDSLSVLYTWIAATMFRCPTMLAMRDTPRPGKKLGWLTRMALRAADRIVFLSKDMKRRYVQDYPWTEAKAEVLYSAVALGSRLALPRKRFTIGYVGACEVKKGQLGFLHAASDWLQVHQNDIQLLFFGDFDPEDNSYARDCRSYVEAHNFANVKFCGYVSGPEEWLPQVDLLLSASSHEGLQRSMLEALAHELPVVSFATCSSEEVLSRSGGGIVVPCGDYRALLNAVEFMIENPEQRAIAGARGRREVEALCNPARASAALSSFFRQAIARE